jgi:LacI family gluconate utilization system Gnt-I transcriptional repressor
LVGFNGLDMCQVIRPRLTTVQTPRFDIGYQTGALLLDRLNGGTRPAPGPLALDLIPGETA